MTFFPIDPEELEALREISNKQKITHDAATGLLKLLRKRLLPTLSATIQTLMKTVKAKYSFGKGF